MNGPSCVYMDTLQQWNTGGVKIESGGENVSEAGTSYIYIFVCVDVSIINVNQALPPTKMLSFSFLSSTPLSMQNKLSHSIDSAKSRKLSGFILIANSEFDSAPLSVSLSIHIYCDCLLSV